MSRCKLRQCLQRLNTDPQKMRNKCSQSGREVLTKRRVLQHGDLSHPIPFFQACIFSRRNTIAGHAKAWERAETECFGLSVQEERKKEWQRKREMVLRTPWAPTSDKHGSGRGVQPQCALKRVSVACGRRGRKGGTEGERERERATGRGRESRRPFLLKPPIL